MRAIYKYEIEIVDFPEINAPLGAKPISVIVQNNKPYVYCIVYPENELGKQTFRLIGTGMPIQDGNVDSSVFIGTFEIEVSGTPFVGHLFK